MRSILKNTSWFVVVLCLFPIISVVVTAAAGSFDTLSSLANTVLWQYARTTVFLALVVGVATGVVGTATAWLVAMCRFPGRRVLEIALALPFAFPAYVLAYAYTDLLDHPGIVQTTLRNTFDLGPRDYWFPEIRSFGGAAIMLTFVLYPYVYLLARAAFLRQSPTAYYAARVLGRSPWMAFFTVGLPVARPAIAGGVILAVMETVADFGTVAHFSVQTLATGIYQAWFSMGDRAAASQLAFVLMMVALMLIILERVERGSRRHHEAGKRVEAMVCHELNGWRAVGAVLVCAVPVLIGFAIPLFVLLEMAISSGQNPFTQRYIGFISNSMLVSSLAAVITVFAAAMIGYRVRLYPSRGADAAKTAAGIGYALPGGVVAVGVLVPFAAIDNSVDAFMRETFDISTGLVLSGTIFVLLIAYMVRFMAAALSAFDTGISQIKPSMDSVARSLGCNETRMLRRVHMPLMRASLLTGLLIVFVDVMKELPATLILRPFNFDTLAVQAYRLASDERLAQAAVPSLIIVAFGLLPVIILCWTIANTRTVHHSEIRSHIPLSHAQ